MTIIHPDQPPTPWTPRTHTHDLLSANDLQAYTSPPPASRLTRLFQRIAAIVKGVRR